MTGRPEGPSVARSEVPTSEGVAHVRLVPGDQAGGRGTLLLGHGAGGHRDAADVLALTALAREGWSVLLVDQPWRVAGRKVATRPPTLDRAWREVTASVAEPAWQEAHRTPLPRPWVVGGRSAGARVACRTATAPVAGVVCLAFPLHPPGRPDRSRAEELARPLTQGLPTLVLQGSKDPFGTPEEVAAAIGPASGLTLIAVPGGHSPTHDLSAVHRHVADFVGALP